MNAVKIGPIWWWAIWNSATEAWNLIEEVSMEDIKRLRLEEKERYDLT
jgi:hypothetical protein